MGTWESYESLRQYMESIYGAVLYIPQHTPENKRTYTVHRMFHGAIAIRGRTCTCASFSPWRHTQR
jgi:hypothetical protein